MYDIPLGVEEPGVRHTAVLWEQVHDIPLGVEGPGVRHTARC